MFFRKFRSYRLSAVNYRKIGKFYQFKKEEEQGHFLRSFFLNYIIIPGILDQIEIKRRVYMLSFDPYNVI